MAFLGMKSLKKLQRLPRRKARSARPLVPRCDAFTSSRFCHLFITLIFRTIQAAAKGKRAETVSIPYDAVPGMDTNSREFHKAILIENAKAGNSSGKRARTEPPFIGSLADLQSLQSSYFIFPKFILIFLKCTSIFR